MSSSSGRARGRGPDAGPDRANAERPNERRRPNIIWVFADQMRAHAMSCAGDPNVRTPNLDRLAGQGVRFTNAVSNYPVCVPARFTLLTGERASSRWVPTIHWRMSPAERTIAHQLGEAGYATIYVGKWHLYGGDFSGREYRRIPVPRSHQGGFDRWQGFEYRNDPFDTYYFVNDEAEPRRIHGYQTDGLFDLAIDELERLARQADAGGAHPSGGAGRAGGAGRTGDVRRPFFLALSVEPPHPPYQGPAYFENRRNLDTGMVDDISLSANVDVETLASDKPWLLARWRRSHSGLPAAEGFDDTRVLKAILREYYQSVENVDWNMGRLIDALERLELWDDTVVMFFSDHGELLGSHGTQGKQLPFAESVGIPLIVCGGALAAADGRGGRLVSNPVSIEDLHSTTLDLAGLPAPASKPGRSLMPLLEPSTAEGFDREEVFLEYVEEHRDSHKSIPPWRAVRTARYSYAITRDGPWLLFDLEDDPYELTNRVGDAEYAETRGNLHRRLVAHLRAIEDPFERMHAHE